MLLYKALGNGKEKVYLYRTNEKQENQKQLVRITKQIK